MSDLVALAIVSYAATILRHMATPDHKFGALVEILPFLAMLIPVFMMQGLYPGILIHPAEELRRIFYSVGLVFLTWAALSYLLRTGNSYSRIGFVMLWALGAPLILLCRYLTRRLFGNRAWWGVSAVILGSGPTAQRIVRKLRNGMLGLKVAGVLTEEDIVSHELDMPPVLGDLESGPGVANARFAQYAIVSLPERTNRELHFAVQEYCRGFSHVLLVPDMPGICSLGISAREIGGELGLELPQRLFHRQSAFVKRALDILASSFLLLLLSPLFAIVAILVKMSSKGPVFFGHSRYGRAHSTFRALKFRTMVVDASRVLEEYLESHPESRAEWQREHKLKNDPRVTKIGKWLRRYSIDELPQLINVFLGHMSLVGPRPIVSSEIPKYGSSYGLYARVRPGITGLWQVSGRNNTTYDERVGFDQYYVNNWSVWLDIYILVRTASAVLKAEGAY
jgi:Undecaprenyl-phosphate galactose phosphotransferase WbaP